MTPVIGLQTSIRSNRVKSTILLICMPMIILWLMIIISMATTRFDRMWTGRYDTMQTLELRYRLFQDWLPDFLIIGWIISIIIIIRWLIMYGYHRQLIFSFTWARELQRSDNPKLYSLVEHLCISQGIATPKIWIIDDDSLNAFAVWWEPKNARIVFSKGMIQKLTDKQLQAVAGHELTHIINKDTQLMIIIVLFVWIIWLLWQIILRFGIHMNSNSKSNPSYKLWAVLLWMWLMVAWWVFLPLIQLAISRKREFLADAGSVQITKDRESMISALQAIHQDSTIESIKKYTVAAMCIDTPFAQDKHRRWFSQLRSTHPSIDDRIQALQTY